MRKHEGIMRHSKEPGHVPKQPAIPTVHMPRNTKTKNNREYGAIRHSAAYTHAPHYAVMTRTAPIAPGSNGINTDYPPTLTAQPVIVNHFGKVAKPTNSK